jgi:hypothetical protein
MEILKPGMFESTITNPKTVQILCTWKTWQLFEDKTFKLLGNLENELYMYGI